MFTYAFRKLVQVPFTLLGLIVIVFFLVHLAPGDPIAVLLGDWPAPPGYVERLREQLGLDRPLHEQLFRYLLNVARGDLGHSFWYSQPVLDLILERAPVTLLLTLLGLVVATAIGVAAGTFAASRAGSLADSATNITMLVLYSVPVFWLAQMVLLVFSLQLGWFPTQGTHSLRLQLEGWDAVLDRARHLVLPTIVLAVRYIAVDFRLVRAGILEVLSLDYVKTARAKGLGERPVLVRHALRNALLPVITITGLHLGFAISGATLIEVVFGWPGIGRLTLDAIGNRDFPVIMGVFIIVTLAVVVMNFLTDFAYAMADPRIRLR